VTPKQVGLIVKYGGIKNLLMPCEAQDSKVIISALGALGAILNIEVGGDIIYHANFVAADGVSKLKKFKSCSDDDDIKHAVDQVLALVDETDGSQVNEPGGNKEAVDPLLPLVDETDGVPDLVVAVDESSQVNEHEESKEAVDLLRAPVDEEFDGPDVVVSVVAQASSSLIGSRVGRRRASNID
jgi:hypothetical protein